MKKPEIVPSVNYSEDYYNTRLRPSHMKICDNKWYAAALWAYFEYRHNLKVAHVKDAEESHKPIPTLWQWQTDETIMAHTLLSKDTIRYGLKILVNLGIIILWDYGRHKEKSDPKDARKGKIKLGLNPIGRLDQRRWLLFNVEVAQSLVNKWERNLNNRAKYGVRVTDYDDYAIIMANHDEIQQTEIPL